MKKNSLTPNKGLSLSQAQSISNLCNQRAREIEANLIGVNNYGKSVNVPKKDGTDEFHNIVKAKPLPENVVELLVERSRLFACQAFLMENIKAKELMLNEAKSANADISSVIIPERPKMPSYFPIPNVTEEFGWEQLSVSEFSEYLEAEAYAAHIGQFIHKDGILDHLRNELPSIPPVEWMTIKDGEKSPVYIKVHHTAENLLKTHEELAALHRKYEQRVNYFKAKVKNLTTEENARIAKINADGQNDVQKLTNELQVAFTMAYNTASVEIRTIQAEFEKDRQAKIKEIAAMRINVDARFQSVVDMFLGQLSDVQE